MSGNVRSEQTAGGETLRMAADGAEARSVQVNLRLGFLGRNCPLFSRALADPWRLGALAAGIGILIVGSHVTPSPDWDYPIFIMGLWAYVFAPWTVRAIVYLQWRRMPLAWLFAWAGIDGVYSLYWWLRGFESLSVFRGPNTAYSTPLYFICGFVMNICVLGSGGAKGAAASEEPVVSIGGSARSLVPALLARLLVLLLFAALLFAATWCYWPGRFAGPWLCPWL